MSIREISTFTLSLLYFVFLNVTYFGVSFHAGPHFAIILAFPKPRKDSEHYFLYTQIAIKCSH